MLHVDRDREQVIAIVQSCPVFKEVEVELTGVAESRTVSEVRFSRHHLGRQGRPRHALHRVAIHESRAARAHRRALKAVEQRNGADQNLQGLKVEGDTTVVVEHRKVDDVFARLIEAVGDIGTAAQGVDHCRHRSSRSSFQG